METEGVKGLFRDALNVLRVTAAKAIEVRGAEHSTCHCSL